MDVSNAIAVFKPGQHRPPGLDMSPKVTRMMIERPENDGGLGWENLFPGAQVEYAKSQGNHFTLVSPPNVSIALRILVGFS